MTNVPDNRLRPHPALVAGGVVALVAGAVVLGAFAGGGESASSSSPGERMRIELVAPAEPKPEPGEVMDVGEVVDGFTYVRADLEPQPVVEEDYWVEEPDFEEIPPPRYRASTAAPVVYPLVQAPPLAPERPAFRRGDLSFGFDRPRPDYGALREARRARLEALALRSSERSRSWEARAEAGVMPPEALRRSDSTFY